VILRDINDLEEYWRIRDLKVLADIRTEIRWFGQIDQMTWSN